MVEFWRRYDDIEARLAAPLSVRMVELAALRPGMRVFDVASGRGEPAIPTAHRVGPTGFVLGIDRNDGVLDLARARVRSEGLRNVDFRAADAETFTLDGEPAFDVATCRWALMYFQNPHKALERIRHVLKPGGALVAAVWAEPERVPYATLRSEVLARYQPIDPVAPDAPGVFRFSDPAVIRRDWLAAGFQVEHLEDIEVPVIEAENGAGIVAWYRAMAGGQFNELPEAARESYEAELAQEAERFRVGDRILLGGVTHLVRASVA